MITKEMLNLAERATGYYDAVAEYENGKFVLRAMGKICITHVDSEDDKALILAIIRHSVYAIQRDISSVPMAEIRELLGD